MLRIFGLSDAARLALTSVARYNRWSPVSAATSLPGARFAAHLRGQLPAFTV